MDQYWEIVIHFYIKVIILSLLFFELFFLMKVQILARYWAKLGKKNKFQINLHDIDLIYCDWTVVVDFSMENVSVWFIN